MADAAAAVFRESPPPASLARLAAAAAEVGRAFANCRDATRGVAREEGSRSWAVRGVWKLQGAIAFNPGVVALSRKPKIVLEDRKSEEPVTRRDDEAR